MEGLRDDAGETADAEVEGFDALGRIGGNVLAHEIEEAADDGGFVHARFWRGGWGRRIQRVMVGWQMVFAIGGVML